LLATIDDLQTSDSAAQLASKRAERLLAEEREKCLRVERELEGWKGLRMERGSFRGGTPGLEPPSRRVSIGHKRIGSDVGRKVSGGSFL